MPSAAISWKALKKAGNPKVCRLFLKQYRICYEYKIKRILNNYFDIMDFRKMKETDNVKTFGKDFMWVILMKKKVN